MDKFISEGVIAHDKKDCLYVYRQTMDGREQYGLVCCVPAKDYFHNIIKKHNSPAQMAKRTVCAMPSRRMRTRVRCSSPTVTKDSSNCSPP